MAPAAPSRHLLAAIRKSDKGALEPVRELVRKEEPSILWEDNDIACLLKGPYWVVSVSYEIEQNFSVLRQLRRSGVTSSRDLVSSGKPEQLAHWIVLKLKDRKDFELSNAAEHQFGICHRLDRDTSGALLVAKPCPQRSLAGFNHLRGGFISTAIFKEYVCLCHGIIASQHATIESPIGRDETMNFSYISESGLKATTIYTVMGNYRLVGMKKLFTLCRVVIVTGRTHQIRCHMASIGHPLLSDEKYNPKHREADQMWCPRMFLHAWRVGFSDLSSRWHELTSPICMDLIKAMQHLERVGEADLDKISAQSVACPTPSTTTRFGPLQCSHVTSVPAEPITTLSAQAEEPACAGSKPAGPNPAIHRLARFWAPEPTGPPPPPPPAVPPPPVPPPPPPSFAKGGVDVEASKTTAPAVAAARGPHAAPVVDLERTHPPAWMQAASGLCRLSQSAPAAPPPPPPRAQATRINQSEGEPRGERQDRVQAVVGSSMQAPGKPTPHAIEEDEDDFDSLAKEIAESTSLQAPSKPTSRSMEEDEDDFDLLAKAIAESNSLQAQLMQQEEEERLAIEAAVQASLGSKSRGRWKQRREDASEDEALELALRLSLSEEAERLRSEEQEEEELQQAIQDSTHVYDLFHNAGGEAFERQLRDALREFEGYHEPKGGTPSDGLEGFSNPDWDQNDEEYWEMLRKAIDQMYQEEDLVESLPETGVASESAGLELSSGGSGSACSRSPNAAVEEDASTRRWFLGRCVELSLTLDAEVFWMMLNAIPEDQWGDEEVLKMWLGSDGDEMPENVSLLVAEYRQLRILLRWSAG